VRVLADVRAATGDWLKMLAALRRVISRLEERPPPIDPDELAEGIAYLEWLADQHFTFLGYREYDLVTEAGRDALEAVPGSGLGILRNAPRSSRSFSSLPDHIRAKAREPRLLNLTKANARSTVHRPTYLDYVGIKRFDEQGDVSGEYRFLGLYTSTASHASPIDVPLLRRKVATVVDRAGFAPASHDQKDLINILETFPRDDLLQMDPDELYASAVGILNLQERRRVRVFVHREVFGRFVSCLVFVPRDRYNTRLRVRIAGILTQAFRAESHEWNARLSESVLARLHFVLHVDPHDEHAVDAAALEQQIDGASRSWTDDLRDELVAVRGEEAGRDAWKRWADAFPGAYQEDVPAADAIADVLKLEALDHGAALTVRLALAGRGSLELKLFGSGAQPSLSEALPRLTNLGVLVEDERPYVVTPAGSAPRWIKYFRLRVPPEQSAGLGAVQRTFEDAFLAVVGGDAEDDSLNRLVLGAGLGWREVALLRAFSRYLRQTGTLYSQEYIADTLAAHPDLARRFVELFVARLDPWVAAQGGADADALAEEISSALDAVESLDADRILRAFLSVVQATLRTNWFQTDEAGNPPSCVVCKLDPGRIPGLPRPRPMFEMWVYSPRVEGVHLRAGRVARGGIRWSDRREDFRTEILGLMKAQRVKNVVIVPSGAKGGFVVKQPPATHDRDALQAEVEACYRQFIDALLQVTDNVLDGAVVPPAQVVRYDGDDPYLVVAADKGTATFSDIANEIALRRQFWLGDAFASGGSAGYDHKAMGITARGAWESVKHHFRGLGVDVQRQDITVVGIGDMSGDVFGNGMLLSEHIRLVAAFDHRHVFLDPDPDPVVSFAERARLFALPRSSWADYDATKISAGGGVHPRTAKAVPISPEVRVRLGIALDIDTLTPSELIQAILRAPVDLLWNGGIGTYVKASTETNGDVGDKANDALRIDARELRCKVVGEGGNLGVTQRGRIEYALQGGLVNTDAIDNSAGVDTSDHEVNIKILLDAAVRAGSLTLDARNQLLEEMTDEVAALVLRDNYRQNRALANAFAQAAEMEDVHSRFMRRLEDAGDLDREVEHLPGDEVLAERRAAGRGLTVPELAVLLAYAKIDVEQALTASSVPDDADFLPELERYFPSAIRERFGAFVGRHQLRREIISTALANSLVNRAGTTFAFRINEETGAAVPEIVRAHAVARTVFDQDRLWAAIEELDGRVARDTQTAMYLESRKLSERATRWLLRGRIAAGVRATIADLAPKVARVAAVLPTCVRGTEAESMLQRTARLKAEGVPAELATAIGALDPMYAALDISELADGSGREIEAVARLYWLIGDRLGLDWLNDRVVELPRADRWQSLSRSALRDDTVGEHRALTGAVLASANGAGPLDPDRALAEWQAANRVHVERVLQMLDEIRAHGVFDLATLSVALRELRALTPTPTGPTR
jgi:glutamate dehydrogenase